MRARRHFQPILDSMPIRIAPSSISGLMPAVVHAAPSSTPSSTPHELASDTLMPGGGHMSPIILEHVTVPSTLPC
jgi:hypothetical protein